MYEYQTLEFVITVSMLSIFVFKGHIALGCYLLQPMLSLLFYAKSLPLKSGQLLLDFIHETS